MNTPTPRTDRQAVVSLGKTWKASYDEMHEHARTLERELATERARTKQIATALTDAISTYFGADKLVTAERIEAWQYALKEGAK